MLRKNIFFKSTEELVSMVLGLLIVVFMGVMLVNYIQKRNEGNIAVPGVSDELVLNEGDVLVKNNKVVTPETIYVVEKDDNLWKIAEKKYNSGYNWVDIAKANDLTDPGLLAVGQKLKLPVVEKKVITTNEEIAGLEGKKVDTGEYIVNTGDSLSKIAMWAYGDKFAWTRIWEANKDKISNPNIIYKGMKLIIPQVITQEKTTSDVGKG